ncbi:hypothetical protein LPC08_14210 [Roseomonas sp. OT10]|uniref:hypothetical protein n=1 Tax=Roseomonas cutis TaxID=2897332 RepID=UPI001E2D8A93|nr:hypothetical protein [Roseomonas sp. OT10]UFN47181.1 hypothetical protein LPC08_14210 [Roseomonas sp. OT10]
MTRFATQPPIALGLLLAAVTAALVTWIAAIALPLQPASEEEELPIAFCLPRRGLSDQSACLCSSGPVEAPEAAEDYRRALANWQAAGMMTGPEARRLEQEMLVACGLARPGNGTAARGGGAR